MITHLIELQNDTLPFFQQATHMAIFWYGHIVKQTISIPFAIAQCAHF